MSVEAYALSEVVGLSPALRMGFDLLRPWGCISSVGVHNAEVTKTSYLIEPLVNCSIFDWQVPW